MPHSAQATRSAWESILRMAPACSTAAGAAAAPRRRARTGPRHSPSARRPWETRPGWSRSDRVQGPFEPGHGRGGLPLREVRTPTPDTQGQGIGMRAALSNLDPCFAPQLPSANSPHSARHQLNQVRENTEADGDRSAPWLRSPTRDATFRLRTVHRPTMVAEGMVHLAQSTLVVASRATSLTDRQGEGSVAGFDGAVIGHSPPEVALIWESATRGDAHRPEPLQGFWLHEGGRAVARVLQEQEGKSELKAGDRCLLKGFAALREPSQGPRACSKHVTASRWAERANALAPA